MPKSLEAPTTQGNQSVVRVRVRFHETDLMGIVHHASYLSYMEVARVEWLRRRGVTYAAWAQSGLHLPVVEVSLKYRAPARFDDEIDVEISLHEIRAASVRFDYRIARPSDGTLCAEGSTRLACVDGRHALRRISPEMAEVLCQPERGRQAAAPARP
jgi:acyl-CoA thioester hydrolase